MAHRRDTSFRMVNLLFLLLTLVTVSISPSLMKPLGAQPVFAQAAEGQVVQEFSGNGTRNLRPFKVRDHWEIRWTVKDGDITIFLASPNEGLPQQAAGQDKPGSGSSYQPKGGTYFLRIVSTGDWTVTVVQLP